MKAVVPAVLLSGLVLGACSSDSASNNGNGGFGGNFGPGIVNDPLPQTGSQPTPANDGTEFPLSPPVGGGSSGAEGSGGGPGIGGSTGTGDSGPGGLPGGPVTGSDSGAIDSALLLNGPSAETATTYWQCDDVSSDSTDGVTYLSFFANGTGLVGGPSGTAPISWTINGPYIELYSTDGFLAQLDNVQLGSSAGLSASYTLSNGQTGALSCVAVSVGGNQGPGNDPVVPANGVNGNLPDILVNTVISGELGDFWECMLADGSDAGMFFLSNRTGGLITADYPEGIVFDWSADAASFVLSLADGNQVQAVGITVDESEYFFADTVVYQGSQIDGMACYLTSL